MLKFIAIFVLIWVLARALGMIFKTLFGVSSDHRRTRYSSKSSQQARHEGDLNVDRNPTKSRGYEGGEYVDYEEVD